MSYDWPTASPESQGVDSRVLKEAEGFVRDEAPYIQAFAVVRGGNLVWESYFGGKERDLTLEPSRDVAFTDFYPVSRDANDVHCIKSFTKCVLSAVTGIAIDRGDLPGVHATLGELLPTKYWTSDVDVRKKDITLHDLLRMRSGLDWIENGPITAEWLLSGDLVGYTLRKQAVQAAPGEVWRYSTADTHLIGVCIAEAAGTSLLDYANRHLLGPLGVTGQRWTSDPNGHTCGGSELFITPRDMAAFAELFRRDGNWQGSQLVPADWVETSIAPQPELPTEELHRIQREGSLIAIPEGARQYAEGYGYKWWRTTLAGHPTYYAAGYGGQYGFVIDDLDLVLVQNASTVMAEGDLTYARNTGGFRLAEEFLVRAVG